MNLFGRPEEYWTGLPESEVLGKYSDASPEEIKRYREGTRDFYNTMKYFHDIDPEYLFREKIIHQHMKAGVFYENPPETWGALTKSLYLEATQPRNQALKG